MGNSEADLSFTFTTNGGLSYQMTVYLSHDNNSETERFLLCHFQAANTKT